MRKVAREVAFKLLYEYLFQNETKDIADSELASSAALDENDMEYLRRVYGGGIEKKEELTEYIAKCSVGYSLQRIYKIDFAILLLAGFEMKYCGDIPNSVSINEAVELSKIYSTERSGKYINGVLGGIEKLLAEEFKSCQQSI